MAERFGGRFSPDPGRPEAPGAAPPGTGGGPANAAPPPGPFRNRRARRVSVRARLAFLLPMPLLFAGLGAIGRGSAAEMLGELGGFAALMLGAWLLNEGLRAEEEYDARAVARPPAIPRKLFAAVLAGAGVTVASWLGGQADLLSAAVFGAVAGLAHVAAFGLDPMRRKGMEGVDDFQNERVAKAIDQAEETLADTLAAAARIGDRRLEGRVERISAQAREVFRAVERDPRDLGRARVFLTVYLSGLRDATVKFADLYGRSRDPVARTRYEELLTDLEASFTTHRTALIEDNRSDLDIEIEVLRERLKQDGLAVR